MSFGEINRVEAELPSTLFRFSPLQTNVVDRYTIGGDAFGSTEKTIKITVKLPKKQYEALKKYADSKHLSMADVVRAFVQNGMSIESYTQGIDC